MENMSLKLFRINKHVFVYIVYLSIHVTGIVTNTTSTALTVNTPRTPLSSPSTNPSVNTCATLFIIIIIIHHHHHHHHDHHHHHVSNSFNLEKHIF